MGLLRIGEGPAVGVARRPLAFEAKEKRIDFSLVPKFPVIRGPGSRACATDSEPLLPPRLTQVLFDVGILAAIGALVYVLWWMVTMLQQAPVRPASPPVAREPEPPSLPFPLVRERWAKMNLFISRKKVLELLGRPTRWVVSEPDLNDAEDEAERANRHAGLPQVRIWGKWVDPTHEDRWVAVLFAKDKSYWIARSPD
jgi:hypothetical protein